MLLPVLGVDVFLDRLIELGLDWRAFELLELLGLERVFGLRVHAAKATFIILMHKWSELFLTAGVNQMGIQVELKMIRFLHLI